MTLKEYVTAVFNGEEVESVSMGGISDGYENAIQHLSQSMMIDLSELQVPEDKKEFSDTVKRVCDKWVDKLDSQHGFSGAQAGAAQNMAAIFWRKSPSVALDEMRSLDPERIIKTRNCNVVTAIDGKEA